MNLFQISKKISILLARPDVNAHVTGGCRLSLDGEDFSWVGEGSGCRFSLGCILVPEKA